MLGWSFSAFPATSAGNWVRSGAARTQASIRRGWQLNSLCHSRGSKMYHSLETLSMLFLSFSFILWLTNNTELMFCFCTHSLVNIKFNMISIQYHIYKYCLKKLRKPLLYLKLVSRINDFKLGSILWETCNLAVKTLKWFSCSFCHFYNIHLPKCFPCHEAILLQYLKCEISVVYQKFSTHKANCEYWKLF